MVGGVAPVGVARLSQTVAELGVPGVGLDVAGAEHLLSLLTVPAREFSHQCPGVPTYIQQSNLLKICNNSLNYELENNS